MAPRADAHRAAEARGDFVAEHDRSKKLPARYGVFAGICQRGRDNVNARVPAGKAVAFVKFVIGDGAGVEKRDRVGGGALMVADDERGTRRLLGDALAKGGHFGLASACGDATECVGHHVTRVFDDVVGDIIERCPREEFAQVIEVVGHVLSVARAATPSIH